MPPAFALELVAALPHLRRFALSLTGKREDAEDLVQAACERALRAQARYVLGTSMDAWMFRIIRNLWIDRIRKRKLEGIRQELATAEGLPGEDGAQIAEARLTAMEVREAMKSLSPQHRQLLTLVCIEELSYREAADRLAVPVGTVMSRLARARAGIMRQLGPGAAAGQTDNLEIRT